MGAVQLVVAHEVEVVISQIVNVFEPVGLVGLAETWMLGNPDIEPLRELQHERLDAAYTIGTMEIEKGRTLAAAQQPGFTAVNLNEAFDKTHPGSSGSDRAFI